MSHKTQNAGSCYTPIYCEYIYEDKDRRSLRLTVSERVESKIAIWVSRLERAKLKHSACGSSEQKKIIMHYFYFESQKR